jgi:hypothetical protein
MTIAVDLLIWLGKTMGGKLIGKLPNLFRRNNLIFTKASGTYRFSYYLGQNHVREGRQKRIYEAGASLTVFNNSNSPRVLRDVILHCVINGTDHPLRLFDHAQEKWQENYQLALKSVTSYSWQAVPLGHRISMWLGSPGLKLMIADLLRYNFYIHQCNSRQCQVVDTSDFI